MRDMKPIAMKCSREQFYQIKPILEEYGLYSRGIDPFDDYPYLINNLGNDFGDISNATDDNKTVWDREVFEEWDQDIFLQYCGIETKPKFIPTAMKCTMEQFQSIEPILLEHRKKIHLITNDFHLDKCYLINYHESGITNLSEESYYIDEARVRCETWDGDLFLKNCGIEVKQKEDMKKVYTRSIEDMMKIHNVACPFWKELILDRYIRRVNPRDGMIEVTEKEIDEMFNAATPAQVPVLEEVFGKQQKKEIDWSRIKTGSKVMIQNTGQHCSGEDIDLSLPVDVVFWKTPHLINGEGKFYARGSHSRYCTFHQNGNYALFSSDENTDYVTEVVKY